MPNAYDTVLAARMSTLMLGGKPEGSATEICFESLSGSMRSALHEMADRVSSSLAAYGVDARAEELLHELLNDLNVRHAGSRAARSAATDL
jgi:hypothetical protein